MSGKLTETFNIIKHAGIPQQATTLDGIKVYRRDKIFIPEEQREYPCTPYDNHFVYEEPTGERGRWSYMCTCGSPAVIVAIPKRTFVCKLHLDTGKHTTGG